MKSLTLIVLIFFSSSVFANTCPNLTGRYYCTFKTTNPEALVISQKQNGDVTVYALNGNEAIADGTVRKMSADEELKNAYYKASCIKGSLEIWQKGELTFADGSLEATLKFSLNSAGQLINESQGEMIANGQKHSLNNIGICDRK